MNRSWEPDGQSFRIRAGEVEYRLDPSGTAPGLVEPSGGSRVLALLGIADVGRFDAEAVAPRHLEAVERHFRSVRARYRPAGWGGMTLLATWTLTADDAIDLVVHLQADSVDELQAVEVWTVSAPTGGEIPLGGALEVLPRDQAKGLLSLDGREGESDIRLAAPFGEGSIAPAVWNLDQSFHAEFACPSDVSRLVRRAGVSPNSGPLRTALFGHALEKGVALRGRIRGVWGRGSADAATIAAAREAFLLEPPPLGS